MQEEQRKKLYNKLKHQMTTDLLRSICFHARQRRAFLYSLTNAQEEMDVRLEILSLRLNPEARKAEAKRKKKEKTGELNVLQRTMQK